MWSPGFVNETLTRAGEYPDMPRYRKWILGDRLVADLARCVTELRDEQNIMEHVGGGCWEVRLVPPPEEAVLYYKARQQGALIQGVWRGRFEELLDLRSLLKVLPTREELQVATRAHNQRKRLQCEPGKRVVC